VLSADTPTVTARPGAVVRAIAVGLNFQGGGMVTVTVSPRAVVVLDKVPTANWDPRVLGIEMTGTV